MRDKPDSDLIELSRAEAAIAIAVWRGDAPPLWARNCFEGTIDEREAESEHSLWVPNELVCRRSGFAGLTLEQRLDAEQRAVTEELSEMEHGYYLLPLHATWGIEANAIVSISGFSFTGLTRKLLGYADDADVLPLVRSKGVREVDFRKCGIRSLPSFNAAVRETMTRVPTYRDPKARGVHAAMANAHYGSIRRSAAKWFIGEYIERYRCTPVGSFSFDVEYGPDLPVKSAVSTSAKGRLSMTLNLTTRD